MCIGGKDVGVEIMVVYRGVSDVGESGAMCVEMLVGFVGLFADGAMVGGSNGGCGEHVACAK